MTPDVTIETLDAEAYRAAIPQLAELLVDAIDSGAGVSFLAGSTTEDTARWWAARQADVESGLTTPFVALSAGLIVGSVLLIRATSPNAPHRAEIGKVVVHRSARRRGIATALMRAAEDRARAEGRWLLVLDTVTGSVADGLYRSLGWHETGTVPNFALSPDGEPWAATFFWKDLR